jgi:hypothetical protein
VTYACNGRDGTDGAAAPAAFTASADGTRGTSSTAYTSLSGGPTVDVTLPSGRALVTVTADVIPTNGNCALVGFSVDGGSASDNQSLQACTDAVQASAQYFVDATPGTHTFTLEYRVSGGANGEFANRSIIVTPLS